MLKFDEDDTEPEGLPFDVNGICELCGALLDEGWYHEVKQLLTVRCDNSCVYQVQNFKLGRK